MPSEWNEASRMVSRPAIDGDLDLLRWMHNSGEINLGMVTELGTS